MCCREGKLRAIGVANYSSRHVNELVDVCAVRPAVLQAEYHPYVALRQQELLDLCRALHITFQVLKLFRRQTNSNYYYKYNPNATGVQVPHITVIIVMH